MNDTDILESFTEICQELGGLDEMGWFQEVEKLWNTIPKNCTNLSILHCVISNALYIYPNVIIALKV